MRNDNKGRDIFYGVVAIATLIVAIVGATLAYFSITANSNEGAINATAATVRIDYNDGQQVTAQANELIPSSFEVVQQVYESKVKGLTAPNEGEPATTTNHCIDANNRQVCSAYRFTVKSDYERQIIATLNNEHNGFTYLSYAVYDVTDGKWLSLTPDGNVYDYALNKCSNENNEGENANLDDDCFTSNPKMYNTNSINSMFGYKLEDSQKVMDTMTIASETHTYELVLFIKENERDQNIDQGQNYRGTIVVEVIDTNTSNGQITGSLNTNN